MAIRSGILVSRNSHAEFSNHRSTNFVHVIWLSIVTWIFSIVAVADCTFVRVGSNNASYSDLSEIGLFQYNLANDEHQCVSFSNTINFSAAIRTARAFGVICCLLTSFIMLQSLSLVLFLQNKREFVWKNARLQAFVAPLAQVLTFTAFGDDACNAFNVKCVPGTAGIIAVANVVLLIALAFVCWFATPPEQPLYEIKRMEAPPSPPPQDKPTIAEDIESDSRSDEAANPEQAPDMNANRDETTDELDIVVKSVAETDVNYPIHSVRPVSPDSEKRRLSFSPKPSPRSRKAKDFSASSRLEV